MDKFKKLSRVVDSLSSPRKLVKDSSNEGEAKSFKKYAWVSLFSDLGDLLIEIIDPKVTENDVVPVLEELWNSLDEDTRSTDDLLRASGDGWGVASYNPEGDRWESMEFFMEDQDLPENTSPEDYYTFEEWGADI